VKESGRIAGHQWFSAMRASRTQGIELASNCSDNVGRRLDEPL
jgi:hypothetical protein